MPCVLSTETHLQLVGGRGAEELGRDQYSGVIVLTILTALEGAIEIWEELDPWMDLWLHSRNLDKVCRWLSGRTVGNDLCTLRVVEVFQLFSGAWGRLNQTNQGYHSQNFNHCRFVTTDSTLSTSTEG